MSQADVIHRVLPSLVNITIWKAAKDQGHPDEAKPLEKYYGSGFVVDPSGLILTNRHVIDGAKRIAITFSDGTRAGARICNVSVLLDLAIVKLTAREAMTAVRWGDSDKLRVGDGVLAIGNPLGVGLSVSAGIVSALHRQVSSDPFDDLIQTDAAINHGNSGGALVNASGEVVGVNTAFLSEQAGGGSLGIGFAIPAFEATRVVSRLKDCNHHPPGWIGVTVQEVTPDIAMSMDLAKPVGSIVTGVAPDSPAKRAGIQEGDVLLELNGETRPTPVAMLGSITNEAGNTIRIGYWRDGHPAEATVTVGTWPGMQGTVPRGMIQAAAMRAEGVRELGVHFADRAGPAGPRVVVASLDPSSEASDSGLHPGDIVLRVDRSPTASAHAAQAILRAAIDAGHRQALILVETSGRRRFVTLPLE